MATRPPSSALFEAIPEDHLHFGMGRSFEPKRVQSFLGLSKEEVASLAGVSPASVRFDKAMPDAVRQRLQELGLLMNRVAEVFGGDPDKTQVWFRVPNRELGHRSPSELIQRGQWDRLRQQTLEASETTRSIGASPDRKTLEAVKLFKRKLDEKRLGSEVILFGSQVRGNARPDSDVDVAVLIDDETARITTKKMELSDLAYDVMLDTGVSISPIPIRRGEWIHPERHSNPVLLANIAREGIRL